jgi:hypothetical protein
VSWIIQTIDLFDNNYQPLPGQESYNGVDVIAMHCIDIVIGVPVFPSLPKMPHN